MQKKKEKRNRTKEIYGVTLGIKLTSAPSPIASFEISSITADCETFAIYL